MLTRRSGDMLRERIALGPSLMASSGDGASSMEATDIT